MMRNFVSAKYETFNVYDTMIKSTDVTNYAVNDVVSNSTVAANSSALTFASIGTHPGQSVIINEVTIVDNYYSTTLSADFNLWLFTAKPAGIADNATLSISDAESLTCEAVIPLSDAYHASTNNTRLEATALLRNITLAANDVNLYGLLEITTTYTPQISEQFRVNIKGYRL